MNLKIEKYFNCILAFGHMILASSVQMKIVALKYCKRTVLQRNCSKYNLMYQLESKNLKISTELVGPVDMCGLADWSMDPWPKSCKFDFFVF